MADPFLAAIWDLHDREKAERRARPAGDGYPAATGVQAVPDGDGDSLAVADPDAFVDGRRRAVEARLRAVPHGRRNTELNNEALGLGHLVGGGLLGYHETVEWLIELVADTWPDYDHPNELGTIQRALSRGEGDPLRWYHQPVERTPDNPADPFDTGLAAASATSAVQIAVPDQASMHTARVIAELHTLRARAEAKDILDNERFGATFRRLAPVSLTEYLSQPDEDEPYLVKRVLPLGVNVTLTAQFKAGKTTLMNNLIKALVDRVDFLDKFPVVGDPRRVVVFNYEVGENMFRQWLRYVGVVNTDAVSVVNLRGQRAPLTLAGVEREVTSMLRDLDCGTWIVDPFARAFVGSGDEIDNAAVGVWTDTIDVIKANAGVDTFVMPVHTGRQVQEVGKERARGATRLDDWADIRWLLTLGEAPTDGGRARSFFSATGRDVAVDEESLHYDEATRLYRMGGPSRAMAKSKGLEDRVLAFVRENPGASQTGVKLGTGGSNHNTPKALEELERRKLIHRRAGVRGAFAYHPGVDPEAVRDAFAG